MLQDYEAVGIDILRFGSKEERNLFLEERAKKLNCRYYFLRIHSAAWF